MNFWDHLIYHTVSGYYRDKRRLVREHEREQQRIQRAQTRAESYAPQAPTKVPSKIVQQYGTLGENIQKARLAWERMIKKGDLEHTITDGQEILTTILAKIVCDVVMLGNIPAQDKISEVELYFAQNRLETLKPAKEFLLDIAAHGDVWRFCDTMMNHQGSKLAGLWDIAMTLVQNGNCEQDMRDFMQAYQNLAYSLVTEMMEKYLEAGYDGDDVQRYLDQLISAPD